MSFGLLEKVNAIVNNTPIQSATKAFSTPLNCNITIDCTNTQSIRKSLNDFTTLKYWDKIKDEDWVIRYVIAVDVKKNLIMLTGKNRNINSYERTYTWTYDKIQDAIEDRGFHLV